MSKLSILTERSIVPELSRRGFDPFTLVVQEQARSTSGRVPDATVDLIWKGQKRRFVVECKTSATPKQIDIALAQLRDYTRDDPSSYPMIVAPYISPSILDRLADQGVSGIDLSGNGLVIVPGEWFILKTGNANQYPSSSPIKNIYRGKSSLVCRALLLQREYPSVGAVVERLRNNGDVTQATVSKVLKGLEEDLLIDRAEGTIRLTQPDELLDRLVRNYEAPKVIRELRCVLANDTAIGQLSTITTIADRADIRYAIDSASSYVPFPGNDEVSIYVESIAPLVDANVVREETRFPTIRLLETTDHTVYFDRQIIDEVSHVSPIQVYLELANGTKREQEISEPLKAKILKYANRNVSR